MRRGRLRLEVVSEVLQWRGGAGRSPRTMTGYREVDGERGKCRSSLKLARSDPTILSAFPSALKASSASARHFTCFLGSLLSFVLSESLFLGSGNLCVRSQFTPLSFRNGNGSSAKSKRGESKILSWHLGYRCETFPPQRGGMVPGNMTYLLTAMSWNLGAKAFSLAR